jgi:DNA gyrase subunit A
VITRRTKFELNKARDRAHILLGLVIAVTNLDEVVRIIRGSSSPAEARESAARARMADGEIAPYIRLVEAIEPRSRAAPIACPSAGPRDPRPAPPPPDRAGPRRDRQRAEGAGRRIAEYLSILADRVKLYAVMREELRGVARVRHAARPPSPLPPTASTTKT